jgi:CBS domain containing-hemolysin-like protein
LLDSLQKAHKTLAVVMDEYGWVAGLATMEDIMEVVFWEIRDETDDETEEFVKVWDDYISVESESLFEDLLGEFDLTLEDVWLNSVEFDGETISYVITKILNWFPTKWEKLAFNVNKEDKKWVLNIEVVDVMDAKIWKVNVKFTKTQEE